MPADAVRAESRSVRTAVLLYGPTFNSLGGGEVWLNRIANAMAADGRPVRVVGKAAPSTVVRHEWHAEVSTEYLEPVAEPVRSSPGLRARVRALGGRPVGAARTAVDRLLRGWRPPSAFLGDISEDAHTRLAEIVNEFAVQHAGRRAVIVCTDVYTGSHIAQLKRLGRIDLPHYVMHHNSFASLNIGTQRAYRRAADAAAAFIALTEEDGEAFRRAGFPSVVTIHNPGPPVVDADLPLIRDNTVGWLARMTPVKRGDLAIRAWARITSEFPDWRLLLYGDGPERRRLERLARRLRVRSSVEFCGVTDDPMRVWSTTAVNLLTSSFEGWPLVIAEAGSMAVPTVATDSSPGVREQIHDREDGLLVPVGDTRALAGALRTLLSDSAARSGMGAAAREHAARFDVERVLKEWRTVLDN